MDLFSRFYRFSFLSLLKRLSSVFNFWRHAVVAVARRKTPYEAHTYNDGKKLNIQVGVSWEEKTVEDINFCFVCLLFLPLGCDGDEKYNVFTSHLPIFILGAFSIISRSRWIKVSPSISKRFSFLLYRSVVYEERNSRYLLLDTNYGRIYSWEWNFWPFVQPPFRFLHELWLYIWSTNVTT